jgi:cell division septum initiation protein DivIVA
MRRFIPVLVISTFVAMTNHPATAEDAQSLLQQIKRAQTNLQKAGDEADALVQRNERLKKESLPYIEQYQGRLMPLYKKYGDKVLSYNAEHERVKKEILRHNAVCKHPPTIPQYEKCKAEGVPLQRKRNKMEMEKKNLVREKADLGRQKKQYLDRITAISKEAAGNFNKWHDLKNSHTATLRKIGDYRKRLIGLCGEKSTAESLKHCHAIGWDGAKKQLPVLNNPNFGTNFFRRAPWQLHIKK